MDYVPTVFAYAKPKVETSKQKDECQGRVDRRWVLAEAELGKENQEDATGSLLQKIELRDVETQTRLTENSDAATQVSFMPDHPIASSPVVCYVPVVSRRSQAADTLGSQLKGNDEGTKFYTGLTSWDVFQHLVSFLSTCYPNLSSTQAKLSPADGLLLLLCE